MKTLSTDILINASMEKVWNVLSDFKSYPDWNPFVRSIEGNLNTGSTLNVTLQIEGRKPVQFSPKLISVTPGEKFCWRGKTIMKGLFDGTHYFILEPIEDGKTHLTHGENFQGILSGSILRRIEEATLQAFIEMNKALKERVEQS